ncbi:PREDICTED: olfactory receptor 2A12-like [Tinamus guttatus]|uniref:olfactory receptor 2A12-like n=1 Tax=Tinamus guttatus TaxID=94827 RepID=UPI00052EC93D|nr:PREDICTED: olfactory receptor 2A12-like [Tinamus guttatus]
MQLLQFGMFTAIYILAVVGNRITLTLTWLNCQLHTVIYFLRHFSFVDICYLSSSVPQMLANLLNPTRITSFDDCVFQINLFLALGLTEFALLVVMAYDQYVAICHPQSCTLITSHRICKGSAAAARICVFLLAMIHGIQTLQMPFCDLDVIKHFYCDILALKFICADTQMKESTVFVIGIVVVLSTFCLILISYVEVVGAISKIHTAVEQLKGFSTYASHLTVVLLFHNSVMRPGSSCSQDQHKMVSPAQSHHRFVQSHHCENGT